HQRTMLAVGFSVAIGSLVAGRRAAAQDPVRLPEVKITAQGSRSIVGIVTDTSGIPVEGADVTIPSLQRRVVSRSDGSFVFDSVPKGKYDIRARKLGYGPQVKEIKIDTTGGRLDNFELVPIDHLLPAVVARVGRLG